MGGGSSEGPAWHTKETLGCAVEHVHRFSSERSRLYAQVFGETEIGNLHFLRLIVEDVISCLFIQEGVTTQQSTVRVFMRRCAGGWVILLMSR